MQQERPQSIDAMHKTQRTLDDIKMQEHAAIGQKMPSQSNGDNVLEEHATRTPEQSQIERNLLRKVDLLILPLLWVTYLLDFLDRSDLGNGAVLGMTRDLHMTQQQLSDCVSLFYVTYVIFQLPASLALRVIPPPLQLACALIVWGLFNIFMLLARNWLTVMGLRLGIGFGEAFFQAAPIYLALWYKRDEYGFRAAIMWSASATSGAFNGLIAYAVKVNLDGAHGLPAWRWLFLIEGVLSVGWAFVILGLLPSTPEKARMFFSRAERAMAVQRTKESFNEPHASIRPLHIIQVLKSLTSYLFIISYSCANISLSAFSSFLPVILNESGYSEVEAQTLSIPIYLCGVVSTLVFSFFSDRLKRRGYFLFAAFLFVIVGWLILTVSTVRVLSYVGGYLISIGTYPSIGLVLSWISNNQAGFTRRASLYALAGMVSQAMAIAATQLYSDPPRYFRGNGFALGAAVVGACTTVALIIRLKAKNEHKRRNVDEVWAAGARALGIEEIGNEHPDFFFFI